MARVTRAAAATQRQRTGATRVTSPVVTNKADAIKSEPLDNSDIHIKQEAPEPPSPSPQTANTRKRQLPASTATSKRAKKERDGLPGEDEDEMRGGKTTVSPSKAEALQTKKLKAYSLYSDKSPFPDFQHPTPTECKLAHKILASLHGKKARPKKVMAANDRAGCGDAPSVLDALVRTILSQNTSDANSSRAKRSMDSVYGRSDTWGKIAEGGAAKLQDAIKCGGLSQVKSKVIHSILVQVHEKYGRYSLDHLHGASNEDAMREMLSFQGVGPKTASCVLLFSLERESFAVDTHVHRITGLLGWRPKNASRDETHAHLDVMIPDEDKYGLHMLLVTHGRRCDECKAGGGDAGKCELRKAFARKGGRLVDSESLDDSEGPRNAAPLMHILC